MVTCPCGARFEAKSRRAAYCSPRCRKRASRAGVPAQPAPVDRAPTAVPAGSVARAVAAELDAANAGTTALGLAAVRLAELVDEATPEMGTCVASWAREMRATLAEAVKQAPAQAGDPLDELMERRRRASRG